MIPSPHASGAARFFVLLAVAALLTHLSPAVALNSDAPATRPAPAAPEGRIRIVGGWAVNPAPINQQQQAQVLNSRQYITSRPEIGAYKLDDLLQARFEDGQLRIHPTTIATVRGQNRVRILGLTDAASNQATWMLNIQDMRAGGPGGWTRQPFFGLNRYDWDQVGDGQFWCVQLNCTDTYTMVIGQGIGINIYYRQFQNQVTLQVTNGRRRMGGVAIFSGSAPTLLQMQSEHPEEVRKYLAPLLIRIIGRDLLRPGAADVYSVFAEIPADPRVTHDLTTLLRRLNAESYPQREAASHDLAKLGVPGILAALRFNRESLTEEQKARFDAFVNTERRRSIDDPEATRRDPNFLLESLDDDDVAVRVAAKNALSVALGHPVNFDPTLPPPARLVASDALRQVVRQELSNRPTTNPTTLPSEPGTLEAVTH